MAFNGGSGNAITDCYIAVVKFCRLKVSEIAIFDRLYIFLNLACKQVNILRIRVTSNCQILMFHISKSLEVKEVS